MSTDRVQNLFGATLQELERVAEGLALPPYAGRQLAGWLYGKNVVDFQGMTNMSRATRATLAARYTIARGAPLGAQRSVDGTVKYLFGVGEGTTVETALIPEGGRMTICLSSQVGCKMGCSFCATGAQHYHGSLDPGQILNQYASSPARASVSNVVFMGMGEPLDNYTAVMQAIEVLTAEWGYGMSPRRITVSTVGLLEPLRRFIRESPCHLAVSLHTPFQAERARLLPAARQVELRDLMAVLRQGDWRGQRRLSFEYVLLHGVNDTARHAQGLGRMLRGMPALLNLIPYHTHAGASYQAPTSMQARWFLNAVQGEGLRATLRATRGEDIAAACGMLSKTTN